LEFLQNIPWYSHPVMLLGITLIAAIAFSYRSEWWLVRTLGRLFSAPWQRVLFRDFYLGDQLQSVVISLQDLEFTLCYFAIDIYTDTSYCIDANPYVRPIIAIIPALLRVLQCFRRYYDGSRSKDQLYNAG